MPASLRRFGPIVAALCVVPSGCAGAPEPAPPISWRAWSNDVFRDAATDDRLVLLSVGARWCHWCHVMDHETWEDPAVAAAVARSFVPVHVDQDSRPDLANRYRRWGWPATIVFAPDGTELVKLRGFVPPQRAVAILERVASERRPLDEGVVAARSGSASDGGVARDFGRADVAALERRLFALWDEEHAGFGSVLKLSNAEAVEYCLELGRTGDERAARMARRTLDAELRLHDPVWGGAYQYSHGGDWAHPHFEKVVWRQADDVRAFALGYALWGEPRWRAAALDVVRYVREFLRGPEGAFFASQDADLEQGVHAEDYFALDDAGRRARGIPAIDRNVYAHTNGLLIEALCRLCAATGQRDLADDARAAADHMLRTRALRGGGFRHGEADAAGPYLADTLAMGRAFLALHEVTGERAWLDRSVAAARFVDRTFRAGDDRPGYVTSATADDVLEPATDWEENFLLARWANLVWHYTGTDELRSIARRAMRHLADPDVYQARGNFPAGALLAARELAADPVHVTVVGARDDPVAAELFATALTVPTFYRRIEWLDPAEGPPPRTDVVYPELDRPAAFVCADGACSEPLFDVLALSASIARD